MSTISEKLNPNRSPRESFGLKAESPLNPGVDEGEIVSSF